MRGGETGIGSISLISTAGSLWETMKILLFILILQWMLMYFLFYDALCMYYDRLWPISVISI